MSQDEHEVTCFPLLPHSRDTADLTYGAEYYNYGSDYFETVASHFRSQQNLTSVLNDPSMENYEEEPSPFFETPFPGLSDHEINLGPVYDYMRSMAPRTGTQNEKKMPGNPTLLPPHLTFETDCT